MKIEKNYDNLMTAWMIVTSALDTINEVFIKNTENILAKDAYYNLLKEVNRWNNEIKKMPF